MIKFREIGTYKNAVNIGYCKTNVQLKNGYGVTVKESQKTVSLPTEETAKENDLYIVINKFEKPELRSPNDYTIEPGEFPRCFRLKSLDGRILDCDTDTIKDEYENILVGDKLVFNTEGKLTKTDNVDGYGYYFEVIDKTSFCGNGLGLKVVIV